MDDADSDAAPSYSNTHKLNKFHYIEGITCALL